MHTTCRRTGASARTQRGEGPAYTCALFRGQRGTRRCLFEAAHSCAAHASMAGPSLNRWPAHSKLDAEMVGLAAAPAITIFVSPLLSSSAYCTNPRPAQTRASAHDARQDPTGSPSLRKECAARWDLSRQLEIGCAGRHPGPRTQCTILRSATVPGPLAASSVLSSEILEKKNNSSDKVKPPPPKKTLLELTPFLCMSQHLDGEAPAPQS